MALVKSILKNAIKDAMLSESGRILHQIRKLLLTV